MVLVAQYFETDPASARFTYDGRTVTAFIQRSGSGARYGGPSVSYWEHQGEASVVWFGRTMKCATK
jgi:membrane-bound inhibitor of C-type lysozyme